MDQNLPPKKGISGLKEKSEHHNQIQHIPFSLGTKFKLNQTVFIFWIKFAQKCHLKPKAEKVNITIEFCIFEVV